MPKINAYCQGYIKFYTVTAMCEYNLSLDHDCVCVFVII